MQWNDTANLFNKLHTPADSTILSAQMQDTESPSPIALSTERHPTRPLVMATPYWGIELVGSGDQMTFYSMAHLRISIIHEHS